MTQQAAPAQEPPIRTVGDPAAEQPAETEPAPALVAADELIEEISIDGMCGVY